MASIIEVYERTYKDYLQAVANASGVAFGMLPPVPMGYIFKVQRISTYTNSSGNPVFELFVGNQFSQNTPNFQPDRTRRVDYTAAGKNDIADEVQPPAYDEGEAVLAYWSGAAQNDVCYATFQIAVYAKWPTLGPHDSRALHHQEMVEAGERASAVVVGGSGWQYGDDPAGHDPRVTEDQDGLYANAFQPWTPRDPADPNVEEPMPPGIGQYVGGNRRGAQHPAPPYPPPTPGEGTARTP